jgi:hypothetical protein
MLKYALFFLAILSISCNNSTQSEGSIVDTKSEPLPATTFPVKELYIETSEEEGWGADLRLSIVSIIQTDTTNEYTALSTYQGKKIGLLVSVHKPKEGGSGFGNGFTLKRTGEESDFLLATLARLYKQKADTSLKFINSISTNYVDLGEYAKTLNAKEGGNYSTPAEYKIFFEGNDDYAEMYVNINPDEHWIELKEKDEEYRPLIIKILKM